MIQVRRWLRILIAITVAVSASSLAANAQGFSRGHGSSGPPTENRPKVDEKAYKSALDRIPVPTEKYDPWGVARTADPAKPPKKPN